MKHISIFVPDGSNIISSIVGPFKVFHAVNQFLVMNGQQPYYSIDVVGTRKENFQYEGIFSVNCNKLYTEVNQTDLIIIPACRPESIPEMLEKNQEPLKWIRDMHVVNGTEVASLCMGAFILASTGLVNGKECSTHWMAVDMFRKMYPEVNLVSHKIITEDDGIYSSGGAFSFLNLLLHLVEKFNGKDMAVMLAKQFEVDYARNNQSSFAMFIGQKQHEDQQVLESQKFIESNFQHKISVEDLAKKAAVSKRNFIRRFKNATNHTPLEYIQKVKIEAAKKMLESENIGVSDVMNTVGYSDGKSFRDLFRRLTGLTPNDYKLKYNRTVYN